MNRTVKGKKLIGRSAVWRNKKVILFKKGTFAQFLQTNTELINDVHVSTKSELRGKWKHCTPYFSRLSLSLSHSLFLSFFFFCTSCASVSELSLRYTFPCPYPCSAVLISAGKKRKGRHLVFFVTRKQIARDGCVSLCGLLRDIVLSYLLQTACTVTVCSGKACLFVFDPLGGPSLCALWTQVHMHDFQSLLGLITHLGMMGLLLDEERLLCLQRCE